MELKKNIAVFTNPNHDLYISEIETPKVEDLKDDEVLVHVKCTGICGSDIHFQKHGRIGPTMVVEDEHILGHESSGEVIARGKAVTHLEVGDKVALEPGVPCGKCKPCLTGIYNGCTDVEFLSTPPVHGFLRRYLKHPARFCFKINDLSFEQGALLEPLSVVYCGIRQVKVGLGQSALVCGAGPIGIVTAKCLAAAGACPIIVTDIQQSRLDFIKSQVPSVDTVLVTGTLEENLKKVTKKGNFDIAIDCTGVEPSLELAAHALEFGGKLHVIGVGKEFQQIPFMIFSVKEISVTFQYRYANTWPTVIKLYENGVVNIDKMVTHTFKLEEAEKAFQTSADPSSGAIKVMILDD